MGIDSQDSRPIRLMPAKVLIREHGCDSLWLPIPCYQILRKSQLLAGGGLNFCLHFLPVRFYYVLFSFSLLAVN